MLEVNRKFPCMAFLESLLESFFYLSLVQISVNYLISSSIYQFPFLFPSQSFVFDIKVANRIYRVYHSRHDERLGWLH
jgi:hypothetical protein